MSTAELPRRAARNPSCCSTERRWMPVSIYRRMGLRPIINAAGTQTRLGGTLMLPEAREAVREAALELVPVEELQAAAGEVISRMCGSEAGYVVSGASAGLTMAACACMAGMDLKRMDALPGSPGERKPEIIIPRSHRNSYDHAFRLAGAELVEVGFDDLAVGCGVRAVETAEIEEAISPETVAVAFVAGKDRQPPLAEVTRMAKERGVPVIVDAAGQLPPPSNLRRFVAEGADLVAFSGGKALRGPQGTGFLAGRQDLISSVALQHLDMDVNFDLWSPPESLIPLSGLPRAPRHGMGRGFKVSGEEIVGLMVALEHFTEERWQADSRIWLDLLSLVDRHLAGIPGVKTTITGGGDEGYPQLEVRLDPDTCGLSARQVARQLGQGSPRIFLGERHLSRDILLVSPLNLEEKSAGLVGSRLAEILG